MVLTSCHNTYAIVCISVSAVNVIPRVSRESRVIDVSMQSSLRFALRFGLKASGVGSALEEPWISSRALLASFSSVSGLMM